MCVFSLPPHPILEMQQAIEYDQDLCALFPHLSSLHHFIGCSNRILGRNTVSAKAFTLLAQAAGDTIPMISGLCLNDPLSPAIFNSFKSLNKLYLTAPPSILENQTACHPESLPSLHELSLCHLSKIPKIFCVLRHVQCSVVLVEYEFNHSMNQGYLI